MKSRLEDTKTEVVKAVLQNFLDTWNAKDLAGFMRDFAEDAEFTDVVGQVALGKEAIEKQHHFAFTVVMKNASFEMTNIYMREVVDGLVMVSANWLNVKSQTPSGQLLPDRNGVIQFIIALDTNLKAQIKLVHNSDFSLPYQRQDSFLA